MAEYFREGLTSYWQLGNEAKKVYLDVSLYSLSFTEIFEKVGSAKIASYYGPKGSGVWVRLFYNAEPSEEQKHVLDYGRPSAP